MPHEQGRLLVDRTGDGAKHPRLFEREHRRHRNGEPTGAGEILPQSRRYVGPLHRLVVIAGRHEPASREEPGGIVEVVPAVPTIVAHPPLVDVGILPRLEAVDGVLVVFGDDRASCRAATADVRLALQEPDPLLVEEVLVAKGSDRTEVDDVAGEFVIEGEAGEDRDLLLGAAVDHHQLTRPRHLTGEPHAAGAHDAAVDEQRDRRADVAAAAVKGIQIGAPLRLTVLEVVVLKEALTGLVADRAIDRMIDEQRFLDAGPAVLDQRRVGDDHGAVLRRRLTAGDELRHHRDLAGGGVAGAGLDEAHPAAGHHR